VWSSECACVSARYTIAAFQMGQSSLAWHMHRQWANAKSRIKHNCFGYHWQQGGLQWGKPTYIITII